jgi:hypothetical protein
MTTADRPRAGCTIREPPDMAHRPSAAAASGAASLGALPASALLPFMNRFAQRTHVMERAPQGSNLRAIWVFGSQSRASRFRRN